MAGAGEARRSALRGSAAIAERILRRASGLGIRFFRFFDREIHPGSPPRHATLELSYATELQLVDLCGRAELDLRTASVAAAFERGDVCVVAYEGGRLAGYCWLAFAPLPHLDGVWVRFAADAVWTYKSLVLPAFRGRGIAPLLYRFADQRCLERQRRCSVICVESHNASSISAALKAGYAHAGSAGYLRRGGLFFDWYSTPIRRDGASFFVPDGA